MKKKILIIVGNPLKESLSKEIAKAYKKGAMPNGTVKELHLGDLKFDPVLRNGYSRDNKLELAIKKSQDQINWADHIVFIFPVWWGTMPSILKGWLDKTLTPGFAFKYRKGGGAPEKLLNGKTSQIIKTTGGPRWPYLIPGISDNLIWKKVICGFVGIKLKRITHFGKITRSLSEESYNKILKKSELLGTLASK